MYYDLHHFHRQVCCHLCSHRYFIVPLLTHRSLRRQLPLASTVPLSGPQRMNTLEFHSVTILPDMHSMKSSGKQFNDDRHPNCEISSLCFPPACWSHTTYHSSLSGNCSSLSPSVPSSGMTSTTTSSTVPTTPTSAPSLSLSETLTSITPNSSSSSSQQHESSSQRSSTVGAGSWGSSTTESLRTTATSTCVDHAAESR